MTLKFQLDSLEGIDESIQALYIEKDGKFVLGIEGLPQQEDVSGLKSKVQELLDEKKAEAEKRKAAEDQARLDREEALRKSGNVEEIEKSWSEKYARREPSDGKPERRNMGGESQQSAATTPLEENRP